MKQSTYDEMQEKVAAISDREQLAVRYLQYAIDAIVTRYDDDGIAIMTAELYGAAAYHEGDVMRIAARINAASHHSAL